MTIWREVYHLLNAELTRLSARGLDGIDPCAFGHSDSKAVDAACETFAQSQKWPEGMDRSMAPALLKRLMSASAVAELVCVPGANDLEGSAASAMEATDYWRTETLRFLLITWWSNAGLAHLVYDEHASRRWPCARRDAGN